jgi:hypothetical protein
MGAGGQCHTSLPPSWTIQLVVTCYTNYTIQAINELE